MSDDIIQAAWLYHVGQMNQEQVSQHLGVSRFRVLRMLAEAQELGLVRISIEHKTTQTLKLADELRAKFDLTEVQVAPDTGGNEAAARQSVGILAAAFLSRIGRHDTKQELKTPVTIGVGWGRTVAAMADALTGLKNPDLRFVSLMGSMTRTSATSPSDVCARLAQLTLGSAMFMPAPFLADSAEDAKLILSQRLVRETMLAARAASHAIISVGECTPDALLQTSGILTEAEVEALNKAGAVADSTGKFFRDDGTLADTDLNQRAPSIDLDDLKRCDVMMIAAGISKTRALKAVLNAGFIDRLIVDVHLAEAVMGEMR
jgi:DNA-binding transcriptional regulator LsrR (DeoR family)